MIVPAKAWMRQATAECYVHSGLPNVTRTLRDRYQLSLSPKGRWPRVSWSRRSESCARILYYHRVNDRNDPFFEAIPTRLFEQQMRYLARYHKVVSMTELLQRLEEGTSPEAVVAVTFDDGYQDNYQNAFPVLQRYGLAATIFLTTGSIDTGEPLWFERLATAVRTTQRSFIDMEVGDPKRFWMRTQSERLQANREIFSILRGLSDQERQRWLVAILQQLGGQTDRERRKQMLTWDQIRFMARNRIEFGGHTVNHPFLSRLTPSAALWEVSECKRRIEEELQQPVEYFAYPNGREEDFAGPNQESLQAAGYRAALTTIWGMNYGYTNRMELRRGGPWEDTAALFATKLDWYQFSE